MVENCYKAWISWGMAPSEFWQLHPTEFWWVAATKNPDQFFTNEEQWDELYQMTFGEE